jgi:ankyrin repeat protein
MKTLDTFDAVTIKRRIPIPVADTCAWILDDDQYLQWLADENTPLLWINGEPGCGKSVLSSFLLEHIQKSQPQSTICYFFCNKLITNQDDAKGLLRGLLHQIFAKHRCLIEHALKDLETSRDFGNKPRTLWDIFLRSLKDSRCGQVILVIDGFDECDPAGGRELLEWLLADLPSTKHKILMTSRTEMYLYDLLTEAANKYKDLTPVKNILVLPLTGELYTRKVEQDVETFIEHKVAEICQVHGLDAAQNDAIRMSVTQKAGKTFLWISLVLQMLRDSATISTASIDRILSSLPSSLKRTYHSMLSQVEEESRPLALKALYIVVAARRPLTLAEFIVAFAIQPQHHSEKDLARYYEPQIGRTVRALCKQFIHVLNNELYLVHSTAKDFLLSQSDFPRPWYAFDVVQAELAISTVCNSYLMLSDFQTQPLVIDDFTHGTMQLSLVEQYSALHPFLNYAALNWADHFRACETHASSGLVKQAMNISNVASKTFGTWFAIYWAFQPRTLGYPKGISSCHLGAMNGHDTIVSRFLDRKFDIRLVDNAGRTPLFWACYGGHAKVVRRLLGANAVVIYATTPQTPGMVEVAASGGHVEVVQELLRATERNEPSKQAIPANMIELAVEGAAQGGYTEIIALLLKWKSEYKPPADGLSGQAQTAEETSNLFRPLLSAVKRGRLKTVVQLLKAGVDIRQLDSAQILDAAVQSGSIDLLRLLLESGANVNPFPGSGPGRAFTPLQAAAERGDLDMVRCLLRAGANVNAQPAYHCGLTALQGAVRSGSLAVVNELLANGADANDAPAPWLGMTAMQAAARLGYLEIAQRLKEEGASPNEKASWRGRTALQWAALNGHLEFVKWLLQFQVDLEALDESPFYRQTAWQLAKGKEDIREVLRAAGAVCKEKHKGVDYMYDDEGNLKAEYAHSRFNVSKESTR